MRRHCLALTVLLCGILACCGGVAGAADKAAKQFDSTIAPLLAARCLECHSGPHPKGELDLSRHDKALAGGENGVVIVAGKPEESLLWEHVREDEMPPKHPLKADEKKLLKDWIAGGAVWGTKVIDRLRYTTDSRGGYDWWSLRPIAKVTPPKVNRGDRARNEIDRFILHRLQEKQLAPSQPADPRTLARRVYFDLTGLPPTPEEVEAFVADPSDAAYQALVDRLLASPHYGERWGRHWLDIARYGESDGFERNAPRKNSWPYRDWVIKALNDDMPYDQFARMQLAGDVMSGDRDGIAAVGFLVSGVHNTVVGGSKRMKLLARQDELEEIVAAVGQTFLGLTVNCARCHDHKFDPVRSVEYYRMISAIDGVYHGTRSAPAKSHSELLAKLAAQIDRSKKSLAKIDGPARKAILAERKKKSSELPRPERPRAYASWEFDKDLKDSVGKLHGAAFGGARIENGALVVDGRGAYVRTALLDRDLTEKTLEAWVLLDNLQQSGGGVMSVETPGGGVFDAIVFAERTPRRWMAGSNSFQRTRPFQGSDETQANTQPVHVAIVYQRDGTIIGYRNGTPYGKPYKSGVAAYQAGKSQVVFGLRHGAPGGNRMLKGRILRANLYDRALGPEAIAASAGVESNFVSEKSLVAWLPKDHAARRARIKKDLATAESQRAALTRQSGQKIYSVTPRNPGAMRVHIRGSVTDYGKEVTPGGIRAVAGASADFGLAANAPDAERRKKLAAWITDSANPLFARVIVNRLWHYHFGTGIVDTPSDLGFNGGRPSHPALLDWLAGQLRANGYRLKPLHRTIVLSATYRQASTTHAAGRAKDSGNRLLWRFSPRRVEAEVLRDSILSVAGALNPALGGPGFEDVSITSNNGTTYYEPIDPEGSAYHRRTVYRFSPRGGRSAILDTFDCPDPSGATPRRSITTTPLQALSLLNNSFVLRMADAFAGRIEREAGKDRSQQIRRAWRLALGRAPSPHEEQLSAKLIARHGLPTLCRALFNVNEFVVIE
ncbi:MAG: DUF1553 domain-containing protein [Planctomycetes bacterium]|nr:DUF1553 domain-containing protein [Planctomycetota bacterium]